MSIQVTLRVENELYLRKHPEVFPLLSSFVRSARVCVYGCVCVCSAVKLAEMHGYVSIQSTNTVILCRELKIFVLCVTSYIW